MLPGRSAMQMYIWDLFADIYVVLRFYLTDCLFPSVAPWQGAGRKPGEKAKRQQAFNCHVCGCDSPYICGNPHSRPVNRKNIWVPCGACSVRYRALLYCLKASVYFGWLYIYCRVYNKNRRKWQQLTDCRESYAKRQSLLPDSGRSGRRRP